MKQLLIFSSILIGLIAGILVMQPQAVLAKGGSAAQNDVCNGIGAASGNGGCKTTSGPTLSGIVAAVINILSILVGVISVIMIILGGFRYVTSDGDSGKISNAKNTIIYALVGLIITAFAQFIVFFVLNKTGV